MGNAAGGSVSPESSRMSFHSVNIVFVVGKESEPHASGRVSMECLRCKIFNYQKHKAE